MGVKRYIVIMAGGIGSRFWPSSTEERPKQFLDILGIGKTMLRSTYERCRKLVDDDEILVVTNKSYYALVKQEIPELEDQNILCEPSRNNTAPCIAYAALNIKARHENSVFAVLASDHLIMYEDAFCSVLKEAFHFVEDHDAIITLGIQPSRADTGYGYIQMGEGDNIKKVISFKEKPDLTTAEEYVKNKFVWNSGMFVWSINTLLKAFEKHTHGIINLLNQSPEKYNTVLEQQYIDEVYPSTTKISIDYAILEKADNVFCLPCDIGWADLGTWASLYSYSEKDKDGNVIHNNRHHIVETENCIIKTRKDKKIVIKGLENFIIVDEEDALLIYPIAYEQEIKNASSILK